jgi:hypothetical protein
MARQPQVTRTIQTTKCNVLCIDLANEQPFTQEVILPRTYKDERSMMKKIKPIVENDNVKAIHVQNFTVESTLYGMTEEEFISAAHILPARTSKI